MEVKPVINISADWEYSFRCACENGHLEVAKWLLEVKPDIHISADWDYAFRYACEDGYLEVAKWLLEVKPDIYLYSNLFSDACEQGYLELAKWLLEINPNFRIYDVLQEYCNSEIRQWLNSLKNHNNKYFKETIETDIEQDCPICLIEKIANCQTNCGHNFCKSCIEKWTENEKSCPMCRKYITNIYNLTKI